MTTFEELRRKELIQTRRIVQGINRQRVHEQQLERLLSLWPVAVGLVLGLLTPWLHPAIEGLGPWAMKTIYPFALLAGRPEVYVNATLAHWLPQIVYSAQFPLEGILIRFTLRSRVTAGGALLHLLVIHLLGLAQLWLLNGGLYALLHG
jgi:hypothetical protein